MPGPERSLEVPSAFKLAERCKEMVRQAGFSLNPYARTYFDGMERAAKEGDYEGVRVQALYLFTNLKAMTPEQKAVKRSLFRFWEQMPDPA